MRRVCICVLLAVCVLLTGCGGSGAEESFEAFSEALEARQSLTFTAKLRAEYEDRTVKFTLDYARDGAGEAVTVRAPELISGITARVAEGSTALEYDGVILDTGTLDSFGLTPMSALPVMMAALREASLDSFWREDEQLVFQLIPHDDLFVTVWFNENDMTPVHAELSDGERVSVYIDVEGWE